MEKHTIRLDNGDEIADACDQAGCTKIIISYAKSSQLGNHKNVASNSPLQPFGLGWQTHRYLCFAKLSAAQTLLKKKSFAIIKYKRKDGDQLIDSVQPTACHLTQFHALFVFPSSITVVSLITQQVVYSMQPDAT